MVAIVVQAEGFERVFAVTDSLSRPQWDRLLTLIGLTIEAQTIQHFQDQAGPAGAWAPRKDKNPWPILIKTGLLRSSIFFSQLPAMQGVGEVQIGTNVAYGRFHQQGTLNIVARPFLGITEQDASELQTKIENYIADLAHG